MYMSLAAIQVQPQSSIIQEKFVNLNPCKCDMNEGLYQLVLKLELIIVSITSISGHSGNNCYSPRWALSCHILLAVSIRLNVGLGWGPDVFVVEIKPNMVYIWAAHLLDVRGSVWVASEIGNW